MAVPIMSEVTGFIANILSNVAFLPQIIKSFKRKRVDDLSIGMFVTLFSTQICWILYAIPLGAANLYVSSGIEIVLLLPIFVMWVMYRKKPAPILQQQHPLVDSIVADT